MRNNTSLWVYWTPRILCILFAIFLSLFSLDVFDGGLSFWEAILALLIHLLPVYVVVAVLILAWRWEWIGAVLFITLAFFYLILTWGKVHWSAILVISGTSLLVGVLFLLNWKYKLQPKAD